MSHIRVGIFDQKDASFTEVYSAVAHENGLYKSEIEKEFKDYLLYYALGFQKEESFTAIIKRPNREYDVGVFYYNVMEGSKIKRIYLLLEELDKGSLFINGNEYIFLDNLHRGFRAFGNNSLDDIVSNNIIVHSGKNSLPYKIGRKVRNSKNYFLYLDSETSFSLFDLSFYNFEGKKFIPNTNFSEMYDGVKMNEDEMFHSFMSIFLTFINSFEEFGYAPRMLIYKNSIMFVDKIKGEDRDINCLMVVENDPMVLLGYEEDLFHSVNKLLDSKRSLLDLENIGNRKEFSKGASMVKGILERSILNYFSGNTWTND